MKINRVFLALIVALPGISSVLAGTFEPNKVYRIRNVDKPEHSLTISSSVQKAITAVTNAADLKQQWYVVQNDEGTGFYLRNVANGAYLSSSNQTSQQWAVTFTNKPDDATMLMSFAELEGSWTIKAKSYNSSYGYAHSDASNNVVCWNTNANSTRWALEKISMNDAEIEAMLKRFQDTGDEIAKTSEYQKHLDALFADKACTSLKVDGDLADNADYQALPAILKSVADKVKDGNWAEAKGDWDDAHARKYRVQLYEPYSEGSAAAGMAGIQAYTNMNNPTGILADANDLLYVMVDSDVPEGATLYIGAVPDNNMYNNVTNGTPLHKGLNIIMCNADHTHYFIYYTVNTVKDKKPNYNLKNFKPIKIHIEGGRLNGFFNYVGDELYAPDTRADYEYTSQRATHPMYDLVGKYVILHFFLNDTPNTPEETTMQMGVKSSLDPTRNTGTDKRYDPAQIMKSWDDMCFAERILMGIQSDEDIENPYNLGYYSTIVGDKHEVGEYVCDLNFHYDEYFNNRMMGITLQAKGLFMNATAWRTAYAPSTISAILTQFHQGAWGPAHEYGHMNQTPMRIAGTTEESNNVFSNVALYYSERSTTSRCDYMSNQLKIFNQGKTFLEHGTWGTTRMFWQLWCYYHATKHNTKFYPRLYELLRHYPLKRDITSIPGKLNPKTDMLHFAKMCCVAAGEDLTNFFTAWGFFVPLNNYHIDDYDVYDCILTQEDIDEVKKEIADFNFPKNDAIILIDDRPGSDKPTHSEFSKDKAGELGGLRAFSENTTPSGNFSYTIDGNTVNVECDGTDGVGYLVFDAEGNLIGFSNSHTFELTPEAIAQLLDGTATVKEVGSDGTTADVVNPVRDGTVEQKKDLLKQLIDRCDELIAFGDETETQVGHLFVASCEPLQKCRNEAYALWETADDSKGEDLTQKYLDLSDKYYALLSDDDARIPIIPGASYRLVNKNYPAYALTIGTTNCASVVINPNDKIVPFVQQWIFEPVSNGNSNEFYLKNMKDGRYIGTTKRQSTELPLVDVSQKYTFIKIEHGTYALAPDNETRFGIHIDAGKKVVQWNTTAVASNWTLTKISTPEYIHLLSELSEKLNQAEELLNAAGTVDMQEPVQMKFTDDCLYTNAPYTASHNADYFTTWNVIFDDDVTTYFHSDYSGKNSEDGLDHYIRIKAPGEETFRKVCLTFTNRDVDNTNTNPKAIKIEASIDCIAWMEVYSASGLPTGRAKVNSTGEIDVPLGTKYIRFMVTSASSQKEGGHSYFCISELRVTNRHNPIFIPDAQYPLMTPEHMEDLYNTIVGIRPSVTNPASTLEELLKYQQILEDKYNALKAVMVTEDDLTDEVTITSAGYTAYVTKFDANFMNTGMTAFKVTKATSKSVTLEEINVAPKGTAVVLKGSEGKYTIKKEDAAIEPIEDNIFMPGGEQIGDASTIYALGNKQGVGFYLVGERVLVPANKGYLVIEQTNEAKTFIPFGDEATNISVVKDKNAEDGVFYNLVGQRIKPVQSGIYIVNGKKVFINK